jgi:diguanylate cyclase (GGDEF)-like protein
VLEYPGIPLPLGSPLYIERPPIEQKALLQLEQPGSLTLIKGSRKQGKTSLMLRLIERCASIGYARVIIDFQQAEVATLSNLDRLLRWFCLCLGQSLGIPTESFGRHWSSELGCKVSCTLYLQQQVLHTLDRPIVLFLRNVDCLFAFPEVTQEFFPLLRSWIEEAKWLKPWPNLRLVLTYASDNYVPLKINQSPFNVGLSLRMSDLTVSQTTQLAKAYDLQGWSEDKAQQLVALVGGHPYLIAIALYHLTQNEVVFESLLESAWFPTSIYSDHLRGYWSLIRANPLLMEALFKILQTPSGVALDSVLAYQLERLGIVRLIGENAFIACKLYHEYFATQIHIYEQAHHAQGLSNWQGLDQRLRQLEYKAQTLQTMVNVDSVTQFLTRNAFTAFLEAQWQGLIKRAEILSVMVVAIDYLNVYTEAYGQDTSDSCLQQVAAIVRAHVNQPAQHLSHYRSDTLLVLMVGNTLAQILPIAEMVREQVIALQLAHDPQYLGLPLPVVTVSIGTAAMQPTPQDGLDELFQLAEQALQQAIRQGGNSIGVLEHRSLGTLAQQAIG